MIWAELEHCLYAEKWEVLEKALECRNIYFCGGGKHDKLILELQLLAIFIYFFGEKEMPFWRGKGRGRRMFELIIIGKVSANA